MNTADRTYRALVEALTRMQSQLNGLAYLLEVQVLVIGSGSIDAVERTSRDIEATTRQLIETEQQCGAYTDQLTGRTGAALSDVIEHSPEPWRGLLDHHRAALGTTQLVVAELAATAARSARRAARRERSTYEAAIGGSADEYSAIPGGAPRQAMLLDRSV